MRDGKAEIAFLTGDPREHHQVVFCTGRPEQLQYNMIQQISFRAPSLAALREKYPQVKFSRCDAIDMRGETKFAQLANYALYLVDTSNHCWRITNNPREAGGVVIAR